MKLYNTLSREKQEFKPLKDEVGFYACGPTVYHYAHIGNLRSYIFMDLLNKTLELNGFKVKLVMNITDVGHLTDDADDGEDKMEKGARREKKTVWDIAEYYTKAFMSDINKLNIKKPGIVCKATDHIADQINMIEEIEKNGFTYETKDGIYFNTAKLKEYGELIPNFNPDNLEGGKRVGLGEKKNVTDFALWKFSNPEDKRQMEWDSPWGRGFPGWHIECTAMGCAFLGEKFDIHTGGVDHITVHHTNELAQARAGFGDKHANYWLHNGHVLVDNEKMAKSAGKFIRIEDLENKGFSPLDYRYLVLQTHYRKQLNFTWKSLESARNALDKLRNKVNSIKETPSLQKNSYYESFKAALNDDLNTSKAVAVLQETLDSELEGSVKKGLALEFDKVLGLDLKQDLVIPEEIRELANKRELARSQKNYEEADSLRDMIKQKGYEVLDTKDGFEIKKLK